MPLQQLQNSNTAFMVGKLKMSDRVVREMMGL